MVERIALKVLNLFVKLLNIKVTRQNLPNSYIFMFKVFVLIQPIKIFSSKLILRIRVFHHHF